MLTRGSGNGYPSASFDLNGDGKIDCDYVFAANGTFTDLFDENQDGLVDWVTVNQKI